MLEIQLNKFLWFQTLQSIVKSIFLLWKLHVAPSALSSKKAWWVEICNIRCVVSGVLSIVWLYQNWFSFSYSPNSTVAFIAVSKFSYDNFPMHSLWKACSYLKTKEVRSRNPCYFFFFFVYCFLFLCFFLFFFFYRVHFFLFF